MNNRTLTSKQYIEYRTYLLEKEMSDVTIHKYLRDIKAFYEFEKELPVTKEKLLLYKKQLQNQGYAIRSINSIIASLNSFMGFLGWHEYKMKTLRYQKETYCDPEKELSKQEYFRLLKASEKQPRLNMILQTICSTGIRISELKYFTAEAVQTGKISVQCKCKVRTILIPKQLKKRLLEYALKRKIKEGYIFQTKSGIPLDRSNIWKQMKNLCKEAAVQAQKVFPHNLRKLFARTFYNMEKDIAKLADILGHGSINTTRIYIMTTGLEHRRKIERLGLLQ